MSLSTALHHTEQHARETALQQGRDIFEMVVAMRAWNAENGGVFVRRSDKTPSNPYLEVPERDPVTTSGIELTLVNPAYMTRQMASQIAESSGIRIHITSLRPINPANQPDDWERAALEAFAAERLAERSEIQRGPPAVTRYMAPLFVSPPCLGCHDANGYQVGDVRGGISVTIPADEFVQRAAADKREHIVTHLAVWALVGLLMCHFLFRNRAQFRALEQLSARLDERVRERTRALEAEIAAHRTSEREATESRRRFEDLVDTTEGIVWEADARSFEFSFVSRRAESLLGYPLEDWRKPGFWVEHLHPDDRDWATRYCAACTQQLEPHQFEYRFIAADGRVVWLEDIVTVVAHAGEPVLLRGLMVDTTRRKESEHRLGDLGRRLTLATRAAQIGIWEYEPATGKVVWDATMHQLFGLTDEQFRGRFEDITPIIDPRDLPKIDQRVRRSMDTGDDFETHFRIRHPTKGLRYIEAHALVVPARGSAPAKMIGINRDITERIETEKELRRLATTDALTGCHNRRHLQRALDAEIQRVRRYGGPLSVIMFDLDHFKAINDRFSHETGDRVLVHVARIARGVMRRTDVLARWGGEEFLALCPGTAAARALVLAGRLLAALRETPAETAGVVSASIGVATLGAEESADDLLKRVDQLMYRAKENGRDRVCHDANEA